MSTFPEGADFSRWPFASGLALAVGRAPVLAWLPEIFSDFSSGGCKLKSAFLAVLASLSRTSFASIFLAVAVVPFPSASLISLMRAKFSRIRFLDSSNVLRTLKN